jgi:MGT family glycosyltransferase
MLKQTEEPGNYDAKRLKGKKILFSNAPADGHFNPLTGLAKYLQELGCDVRWYASGIFKDKLKKLAIPHLPYVHAKDINVLNLEQVFPQRQKIQSPAEKLNFDLVHFFGKRAPEYFEDLREIRKEFPFDVLIADSLFTAIPLVKEKMKIPVIAIGIIPLAEDSEGLAPYGMGMLPTQNDEGREEFRKLRDLVNGTVFKESIDVFDDILKGYDIQMPRSFLFNLLIKASTLYLQIGTPSFEYDRKDIGENVHFIGALLPHWEQSNKIPWFDERLNAYEKVILVTQGTAEKDPTKLLKPVLEAYKGTDVLVVGTIGGGQAASLREEYTYDNIIIEAYIPFEQVMPYADVFITNGGYGGVLLSIKNHLPVVAAGVHEGKIEVCSRVGFFELGIDLQTETPSGEAIKEAVDKIFADRKYKLNITKLSQEINNYDGNLTAAHHVARLLGAAKQG